MRKLAASLLVPIIAVLAVVSDARPAGAANMDLSVSDGYAVGALAEGNSGSRSHPFRVRLVRPSWECRDVTVNLSTQNGTAVSASDYGAVATSVVFAACGSSARVVGVNSFGDRVPEGHERFHLGVRSWTVEAGQTSAVNVSDGTGTSVITNDDTRVTVGDVAVAEGQSGTTAARFPVTLRGARLSSLTLYFHTHNGTAAAPSDFVAVSPGTRSLTFPASGAASQTKAFPVTVKGDTTYESTESFALHVDGHVPTWDYAGTGTITQELCLLGGC